MTHDYYKMLGLDFHANEEQIRRSFRHLAKKYHPDTNRGNEERATRAMHLLIQAYRTLMDHAARMLHDDQIRLRRSREEDSFLVRMRTKRDDPAAQTRLVLYCLLHNRADEALAVYDRLKQEQTDYDPAKHLEGRDHLDFLFLLAEFYERRSRQAEAARVYERLYRNGKGNGNGARPNKFYYRELQLRLRNLYFRDLPRGAEPREALRYYRRGLKINQPKRERAFAYKKMAECCFDCGQVDKARECLQTALTLVPGLKGIKKISRKLAAVRDNLPS